MIVILGKNSTYGMNDDFPIFSIPVGMENATTQSLTDFQWWAYSTDFQKWLKENPREWTADSESMEKYGSLENFIKENFQIQSTIGSSGELVLSFDGYQNELNEAEAEEDRSKQILKLHYAYNQLLSEGKIKGEFVVANETPGEEKAIFLSLDDDQNEEIVQSLGAYKITALPTSENSKMALFRISEVIPGGKITEEDTAQSLLDKSVQTIAQGVALSAVGLGAYYALTVAGSYYGLRLAKKQLLNLLPAKPGSRIAALRKIAKRNKNVKGLVTKLNLKRIFSPKTAGKFYSGVGKALSRGVSGSYKAITKGKSGASTALKAFAKGTSRGLSKIAPKAAVDWIPIVGWALAAIDVVGSTWNWFSGKQAPLYSDIKDFAKDEFVAKSIPIGIPITICWSQEAGGAWGTLVNFVANNDTRTTMEIVKMGDFDGKSIFILTQINSKELGKQLAEHDLTLIAFDSSEKVETGIIDNDDLDFEISTIDGLNELSVIYNFKGVCDWNEASSTYDASSDRILISDPGAPKDYQFYFEDTEGEKINVSGELLSDEQISKMSDTELQGYFSIPSLTNENLNQEPEWDKKVLESKNILSFGSFSDEAFSVNEEEEGSEESLDLKPAQMVGPQKLAIFIVKEKQYANPELRGKFKPGDFRDFVINPEFWKVSDGTKIEVLVDTDEMLEDTIKGVYTYKEDEGKDVVRKEEKPVVDQDPKAAKRDDEEEGEKLPDDYYITASPDDIGIKQKERSTTIRDYDYSGGLNLFDTFLTNRQKEILGIDLWKTITFAKEFYDKRGDVIEVKFKNRYAPFGDRTKKYRVTDGESFEIAKKFVEDTKERIKYE
jgi:hypothetical protein